MEPDGYFCDGEKREGLAHYRYEHLWSGAHDLLLESDAEVIGKHNSQLCDVESDVFEDVVLLVAHAQFQLFVGWSGEAGSFWPDWVDFVPNRLTAKCLLSPFDLKAKRAAQVEPETTVKLQAHFFIRFGLLLLLQLLLFSNLLYTLSTFIILHAHRKFLSINYSADSYVCYSNTNTLAFHLLL